MQVLATPSLADPLGHDDHAPKRQTNFFVLQKTHFRTHSVHVNVEKALSFGAA